jgi:prophage regulatory protein
MAILPEPKQLPATGFIRLPMLFQFVPISKASYWRRLKNPDDPLPRPVKLGPKTTAVRVEDVRKYLDSFGGAK